MAGLLSLKWNNHCVAFLNLINSLYSKELYCDATIVCHGKYYPVHSMVLSTCSEYFQEIFNQSHCKRPFIIVNDVQPSEIEALLSYMYKGNVNVLQEMLPSLIKAAEALKVKGLAVPDQIPAEKDAQNSKKRSSSLQSSNSHSKKSKHSDRSSKHISDKYSNDVSNETNNLVSSVTMLDKDNNSLLQGSEIKEEPLALDDIIEEVAENNVQDFLDNEGHKLYVKCEPYDPSYSDTTHMAEQYTEQFTDNPAWCNTRSEVPKEAEIHSPYVIPQPHCRKFPLINEGFNYSSILEAKDLSASRNLERFKCPYCPHSSSDFEKRVQHITLSHYERLPFGCSFCSYRCYRKSALLIHTRKHTGERPFSCPEPSCNYHAASNSNLKKHLKNIHNSNHRPNY